MCSPARTTCMNHELYATARGAVALLSENVFNGCVFVEILLVFRRLRLRYLPLLQRWHCLIAVPCRREVARLPFCRTTAAWRRSAEGRAVGGLASQLRDRLAASCLDVCLDAPAMLFLARFDISHRYGILLPLLLHFVNSPLYISHTILLY